MIVKNHSKCNLDSRRTTSSYLIKALPLHVASWQCKYGNDNRKTVLSQRKRLALPKSKQIRFLVCSCLRDVTSRSLAHLNMEKSEEFASHFRVRFTHWPWWWKQIPVKSRYPSNTLHRVTPRKTAIFVVTVVNVTNTMHLSVFFKTYQCVTDEHNNFP
jgi:hypothetical protein